MKKSSLYSLCKHDLYLAAALAGAAVLLFLLLLLLRGSQPGTAVIITVDGQEYGTYSLDEEQDIVIDTRLGHNHIHIGEGTVYMEEADCPDRYCVSTGHISRNGDTIVCLPHRVVARILVLEPDPDGQKDEIQYDAIAE